MATSSKVLALAVASVGIAWIWHWSDFMASANVPPESIEHLYAQICAGDPEKKIQYSTHTTAGHSVGPCGTAPGVEEFDFLRGEIFRSRFVTPLLRRSLVICEGEVGQAVTCRIEHDGP